jgi:uncharacterized protein (UPF0303 family)
VTPEEILAQEERLTLVHFSNDDAVDLGLIAVQLARRRSLPIVVEIRGLEQVLFRAALPGSSVVNDGWVARKARLVEELGHATLYQRMRYESAGTTFAEATGLSEDDYAAHGGGFPLTVVGEGRVGVMVVSGLPQLDDHRLVVECLEMLQKSS